MADTNEQLAELRATCPVAPIGERMYFVTSRAGAVEVLSDAERFSTRHGESPPDRRVTLFEEDPERHALRRRILARAIRAQRSPRLTHFASLTATRLVRNCLAMDTPDGVRDIAEPMTRAMVGELLGIDPSHQPRIFGLVQAVRLARLAQRDPFAKRVASADEAAFRAWVLEDAVHLPPDRSALAQLASPDRVTGYRLTDDELVMDAQQLCQSGSGATRLLIGNVLLRLASDPQLFQRVQAQPSRVPGMVEESLRFDAPVRFAKRTSRWATTVAGTAVNPGDEIMMSLSSANRDEAYYAEGEEFDIDRERKRNLAFGWGPHRCPGVALARVAAIATVNAVAGRISDISLPDDFIYEGQPFLDALRFHGPARLPLWLTALEPSPQSQGESPWQLKTLPVST